MNGTKTNLIQECKQKLVMMKAELLNRMSSVRWEMQNNDKNSGDEIDQTVAMLSEHTNLVNNDRIRTQLMEIEFALARIQRGEFGICEETFEPIEADRLLAIPYTRLSIEGAEIREASRKFKFR
jgi:DnaK suppressor protein